MEVDKLPATILEDYLTTNLNVTLSDFDAHAFHLELFGDRALSPLGGAAKGAPPGGSSSKSPVKTGTSAPAPTTPVVDKTVAMKGSVVIPSPGHAPTAPKPALSSKEIDDALAPKKANVISALVSGVASKVSSYLSPTPVVVTPSSVPDTTPVTTTPSSVPVTPAIITIKQQKEEADNQIKELNNQLLLLQQQATSSDAFLRESLKNVTQKNNELLDEIAALKNKRFDESDGAPPTARQPDPVKVENELRDNEQLKKVQGELEELKKKHEAHRNLTLETWKKKDAEVREAKAKANMFESVTSIWKRHNPNAELDATALGSIIENAKSANSAREEMVKLENELKAKQQEYDTLFKQSQEVKPPLVDNSVLRKMYESKVKSFNDEMGTPGATNEWTDVLQFYRPGKDLAGLLKKEMEVARKQGEEKALALYQEKWKEEFDKAIAYKSDMERRVGELTSQLEEAKKVAPMQVLSSDGDRELFMKEIASLKDELVKRENIIKNIPPPVDFAPDRAKYEETIQSLQQQLLAKPVITPEDKTLLLEEGKKLGQLELAPTIEDLKKSSALSPALMEEVAKLKSDNEVLRADLEKAKAAPPAPEVFKPLEDTIQEKDKVINDLKEQVIASDKKILQLTTEYDQKIQTLEKAVAAAPAPVPIEQPLVLDSEADLGVKPGKQEVKEDFPTVNLPTDNEMLAPPVREEKGDIRKTSKRRKVVEKDSEASNYSTDATRVDVSEIEGYLPPPIASIRDAPSKKKKGLDVLPPQSADEKDLPSTLPKVEMTKKPTKNKLSKRVEGVLDKVTQSVSSIVDPATKLKNPEASIQDYAEKMADWMKEQGIPSIIASTSAKKDVIAQKRNAIIDEVEKEYNMLVSEAGNRYSRNPRGYVLFDVIYDNIKKVALDVTPSKSKGKHGSTSEKEKLAAEYAVAKMYLGALKGGGLLALDALQSLDDNYFNQTK